MMNNHMHYNTDFDYGIGFIDDDDNINSLFYLIVRTVKDEVKGLDWDETHYPMERLHYWSFFCNDSLV